MFRRKLSLPASDASPLPSHIAIIMDGNGRWAERRGLPRTAGHRAGLESTRRVIKESVRLGIKYLTLYTFSTENWKRPSTEVEFIMSLPGEFWRRERSALEEANVRIKVLGDINGLPLATRHVILEAVAATQNASGLTVSLALNYGGRAEIVRAARLFMERYGIVGNEADFATGLYTAELPDPELLIRPGGERRISNFLLWQLAYTELFFVDKLWPDFDGNDLVRVIEEYRGRSVRRGGL
ncbi:MAG: Ditrans,polycis-undecaprenyl-diphosphate synthase ((2E,6E)-farnesyl-diphosphate specific) [Firmicutes bacterium]|nr:Ditrans,polycis-undecaprenyl-diphosphate synthase ((2E,6E)-farnesyl-diphosphate specific) [candidate division NPL-UPA2 bacterium]MBT9153732.1 Ditrans,polycis-undecaprenyl-diphosphate synthase ((2E,6E)-farnesyl-diphosphate specific) [candidate division NPL-UPA2 bacterium]